MSDCFMSFSDIDGIVQCLPTLREKLHGKSLDDQSGSPFVIGFSSEAIRHGSVTSLAKYFMWLCRKYYLLKNERLTLLSDIDEMVALQLCLAETNKQKTGEYDIEASAVIHNHNNLVKQKLANIENRDVIGHDVDHSTSVDLFNSDPDISFNSLSPGRKDEADFSQYHAFLSHCNYVDLCDILCLVQEARVNNETLDKEISETLYVFNGMPKGQVQNAMMKFLTRGRKVITFSVEVPLETDTVSDKLHDTDTIPAVTFLDEGTSVDELMCQQSDKVVAKSTVKKKKSVTECHLDMIFMSYLEVLVNSRSELALARVINTPERGLDHTAFTDLKHEAKAKGMTMYQTAVSFVMRLRLSRQGYILDPNNILAAHVKGLSEFVDMMQRMQTVIEEDTVIRSACGRVLNIIKKTILKCQGNKIRDSSMESVTEQLQDYLSSVVTECGKFYTNTPDKGIHNGGSLQGRRTIRVLSHLLDRLVSRADKHSSLHGLTDAFSSQRTPLRFPSLLSQFRSPDEEEEDLDSPCSVPLAHRLSERQNNLQNTKVSGNSYKSYLDWAMPNENTDSDIILEQTEIVMPSKTVVHPGKTTKTGLGMARTVEESRYDQENIQSESVQEVTVSQAQNKDRGQKRQLAAPSQPPAKKRAKPKEKTCRRKLLPQVKGQQKLTGFFRV